MFVVVDTADNIRSNDGIILHFIGLICGETVILYGNGLEWSDGVLRNDRRNIIGIFLDRIYVKKMNCTYVNIS